MQNLGRPLIVSPGLQRTFRVQILERRQPVEGFDEMEFRAGVFNTDGEITALQVDKHDDKSIVVTLSPEVISALPEMTDVGVMYKRTADARPQGLGFITVRTIDRGHRWI